MILIRLLFGCACTAPALAIALLSFSPSSGMDIYVRPLEPSLKWWAALLGDKAWLAAALNSTIVAACCTALSMMIAVPAAASWRISGGWIRSSALTLSTLSFVLPPVVLAVALYMVFVRTGLFDNRAGLVLAHMAMTLPLTLFVLRQRLASQPISEQQIARALGASYSQSILAWLRSSHRATLWAAAGIGFMASMSEATLTIMLTDTRVRTLPQRIVSSLAQDISPTGYAAMAMWMILVAGAVFAVNWKYEVRRRS